MASYFEDDFSLGFIYINVRQLRRNLSSALSG